MEKAKSKGSGQKPCQGICFSGNYLRFGVEQALRQSNACANIARQRLWQIDLAMLQVPHRTPKAGATLGRSHFVG